MKGRYLRPDNKGWILVDVFEKCGEYYRIFLNEWYGIPSRTIYVPIEMIEFITNERP